MTICANYRIPHSEFLSWEKDDRDKAIWHHIDKLTRCGSCGTHPNEWNPAHGGNPFAYIASRTHCRGCQVLAVERDRIDKEPTKVRGTYVTLRKPGVGNGAES